MSRFVFGPGSGHSEPAPDSHAGLTVPKVTFREVRRGGLVDLTLEAGGPDAATLLNLYVVYLPGEPADLDDPKSALDAAAIKGMAAADDLDRGGDFTVPVTGRIYPGSTHYVQVILEIPD